MYLSKMLFIFWCRWRATRAMYVYLVQRDRLYHLTYDEKEDVRTGAKMVLEQLDESNS